MYAAVKIAGIICIAAASVRMGELAQRRLKDSFYLLRELCDLFSCLEKEMLCHHSPLEEALAEAARHTSPELKQLLLCTAEEIAGKNGRKFRVIWEEAVQKSIPARMLAPEARELLLDAAEALCNTDLILQQAMLKKYQDRFEQLRSAAGEAWREKGNLYRKLSIAAGAFLILLLL